jgi:asparagine synthetase B (glutamine-hydrolysing)
MQMRHDIKLLLLQAVKRRALSIPSVVFGDEQKMTSIAIMFSGGLDSTLLAAVLAETVMSRKSQKSIRIDLINVSFAPENSADRITGIFSYYELKR